MPRDPAKTPPPELLSTEAGGGVLERAVDELADDTRVESEDDPSLSLRHQTRTTPMPGSIGTYRILNKLGTGGMGTVYLAEQVEPVKRQVALKVIRSRYSTDEGRIRFETERQAMARLQHPNVAQIFEAGTTEDGHPFFVMELIEGRQITTFCEEKRLRISERLELFRSICAGVHHAHQKGIIHRDLKPSNVLIAEDEGRPVPKIIDFGIAKTLDDDEMSSSQVTGDRMLGTPAYLSPEAARLGRAPQDLDTRADVYALGILLYEILVGCRPYDDTDGLFELLRRITEGEPPSPHDLWQQLDVEERQRLATERRGDPTAIGHRLRGDLEWIILKAIARDRHDRYDSAAALAADIERHLQHEPVEASPPSKIYRLRKFIRRRSGVVAALGGVMLALGLGLAARTIEADRANRAAQEAIAARLETEAALQEAEQARAEAAQVSDFLLDIFRVSDPSTAQGQTVTARELLDEAATKVRDGFADQPTARARFMRTIADVYRKLGLYDPSLELAEESLELRREHLPARHPDIAESLSGLAALYAGLGRFEEAAPLLEESLEIRMEALASDAPEIALTLNDLANVYTELGRAAEAEPLYLRSIEMNQQRSGPPQPEHLAALNNLAVYYSDAGRYDEAEPLLRQFLDQLEAMHGRRHLYTAFALENLADVRGKQGAVEEALELFAEAEQALIDVLGAEHPEVAYCLRIRADLLRDVGRSHEAAVDYRRALELQRAALPADHPEIAKTLEGLQAIEDLQTIEAEAGA